MRHCLIYLCILSRKTILISFMKMNNDELLSMFTPVGFEDYDINFMSATSVLYEGAMISISETGNTDISYGEKAVEVVESVEENFSW